MPAAIAALLMCLALHPAQSPKPRRITRSDGAQVGNKANPAQGSSEKEKPSPNAPTIRSPAETENNPQSTRKGDEGVHIQWELEIATWVLVAIGVITASFICWQAWETRKAAEATQKAAKATEASVDLQRVAMEQWIDTDDWKAGPVFIQPTATEAFLPISFDVVNTTKFKMILDRIDMWIDREEACTSCFGKQLLTPDGGHTTVSFQRKLEGLKLEYYRRGLLSFEIGGVASYWDAFGQEQRQRFGFHCQCRMGARADFQPIAFSPPDARELEAQQRRKARIGEQNPN